MINGVIDNHELCDIILKEAAYNIEQAQKYLAIEVEVVFPEISKSIQHRRAEYYILTKKSHYVQKMQHHGQIEENDAKNLLEEIDSKIFDLHHQPIEIELVGNKEKIAHQSELAEIFTKEELDDWIET